MSVQISPKLPWVKIQQTSLDTQPGNLVLCVISQPSIQDITFFYIHSVVMLIESLPSSICWSCGWPTGGKGRYNVPSPFGKGFMIWPFGHFHASLYCILLENSKSWLCLGASFWGHGPPNPHKKQLKHEIYSIWTSTSLSSIQSSKNKKFVGTKKTHHLKNPDVTTSLQPSSRATRATRHGPMVLNL